MSTAKQIGEHELAEIAARWRQLSRDRVAAKRSEVVEALAGFIVEGIDRIGGTLLIAPSTFARILVATSDSVVLASELDDVDLYRPVIEMYTSAIKFPPVD